MKELIMFTLYVVGICSLVLVIVQATYKLGIAQQINELFLGK